MKKKIIIPIVVILVLIVISGITNYIDGGRVSTGVEPVCSIKIVSEDGNKVTYWGLGYKVIRYPSVSPNEPFKNNRGVKMGNWFIEYEPEEYSIVNVYYESKEETEYPEKIYEDDAHNYYLPYYNSENIIVEDSDKVRVNLKEALSKGKISIDVLTKEFDIKVIEEKKLLGSNEKSVANIPNVKFLANKTKEEVENALLGVPQNTIHDLWGDADIVLSGLWGEHWMFDNDTQSIALLYAESSAGSDIGVVQFVNFKTNLDEELLLQSEDGMKFKLNADMSTISKEPISEIEGRGDGFHWKEYTYEDIFVKALIEDNNTTGIILISTTSNNYRTPRDIKVGDTLQDLQEKYKDELTKANSDETYYIYKPQDVGFNRIYFYIENDIITEIKLENGIDG